MARSLPPATGDRRWDDLSGFARYLVASNPASVAFYRRQAARVVNVQPKIPRCCVKRCSRETLEGWPCCNFHRPLVPSSIARHIVDGITLGLNESEVPDHILNAWGNAWEKAKEYLALIHYRCRDPRKSSGAHESVKTAAQPVRQQVHQRRREQPGRRP
jgi:hypothetical protein